jgi:hypothetical protein
MREDLEVKMWERLRQLQKQYKKGCKTCEAEMATAIDTFRKDFEIKASSQEILAAFGQDSFAMFLDKMLIPEHCREKQLSSIKPGYKVATFPKEKLPPGEESYNATLEQIKSVLGTQKVPIGLSFCAQAGKLTKKSMDDCRPKDEKGTTSVAGGTHSLVISGYRKVCKKGKPETSDNCYDAVQVQNSWGIDWQQSNQDGWVDAKELLQRSFYEPAALTWLESKKK